MLWSREQPTVRVGQQVHNATIDRDLWLCTWHRIWDLDLANDRYKPLATVTTQSAGLRSAFERTVHNNTDLSELGKGQDIAFETPYLWMWLTEIKVVLSLTLE